MAEKKAKQTKVKFLGPATNKRFWSFITKLRKDRNRAQILKIDGNVITDCKGKASAS